MRDQTERINRFILLKKKNTNYGLGYEEFSKETYYFGDFLIML